MNEHNEDHIMTHDEHNAPSKDCTQKSSPAQEPHDLHALRKDGALETENNSLPYASPIPKIV
jgi:hypothetical protein